MSRAEKAGLDISPAFALAAAFLYLFDEQGIFALAAISAAVHEAGHYAALCAFGAKPYLLRLELTGAAMYFDESRLSYGQELIAALAGPLAGLLLAFGAAFGGAYTLAGVSLTLSLFNLLPVGALDGGRVLTALLSTLTEAERARLICSRVTLICAVMLLLGGIFLLIYARSGAALVFAAAALLIKERGLWR